MVWLSLSERIVAGRTALDALRQQGLLERRNALGVQACLDEGENGAVIFPRPVLDSNHGA